MNTALLEQYAALKLKIRKAEENVDELKEQAKTLEADVLQEFEGEQVQNVRLKSGVTVFLKKDIYAATPQGKEAAVALLKRSRDYKKLVQQTVNSNSLSAQIRELLKEKGTLPKNWAGIIDYTEKFSAGVNTK